MAASLQHEAGNLYRVNASGLLRNRELDAVREAAIEGIERLGSIRLLFVLDRFEGWERGVDWGNMTFYLSHGQKVERIAVVGDERWRDHALMFAGAGLRRAPVRYFLPAEAEGARAWLSEGVAAAASHAQPSESLEPPKVPWTKVQ